MDAYSSSKIAIMRPARGLFAICGICKNSSLSNDPDPLLLLRNSAAKVRKLDNMPHLVCCGSSNIGYKPIKFHKSFLQTFQFTGIDYELENQTE